MQEPKSILLIRADRIGDVVLSTPVVLTLRKRFPNARITLLCSRHVAPLMKTLPELDQVLFSRTGSQNLFHWVRKIGALNADVAVVLNDRFFLSFALWLAKVPLRIGVKSKWWSYLFFNRGVRQHRSEAKHHEAEYSLALLKQMGVEPSQWVRRTKLVLEPSRLAQAQTELRRKGIRFHEPFVCVHPGMGGSALNISHAQWASLIEGLLKEAAQVLVTLGPREGKVGDQIFSKIQGSRNGLAWWEAPTNASPQELAAIFSFADHVIAPSTGPLHIAHALGIPVTGFYSPIQVQRVTRWGPYGGDAHQRRVFEPHVHCEQVHRCKGETCEYFPCMKTVSVDRVVKSVVERIQGQERPPLRREAPL